MVYENSHPYYDCIKLYEQKPKIEMYELNLLCWWFSDSKLLNLGQNNEWTSLFRKFANVKTEAAQWKRKQN